MPRVPSVSPATGKQVPTHFIHTADAQFVDNAGRTVLLRGINLSGADKAPIGAQSQTLEGLWEAGESGEETFVGRPLNLYDGSADVHLARLKGWGFNTLRYVVTWEAMEHAGPYVLLSSRSTQAHTYAVGSTTTNSWTTRSVCSGNAKSMASECIWTPTKIL